MSDKSKRLDDAARAAWLYYIAGNTQDEVAAKLGVSRQSAQRLVAQAMQSGLVKVRIDHPIARCLDLAGALRERFGLAGSLVVPSDPATESTTLGLAEALADAIEGWLTRPEPVVMALGTGRTLRAAVSRLPRMECSQHSIVSLTGNISPDGSTATYNVIFSVAELLTARTFPMPLPVIASSAEERAALQSQAMVRSTLEMTGRADVAVIGIGEIDESAPLYLDGFISRADVERMRAAGAVGEIIGWAFDAQGRLIEGLTNDRVSSAPIPSAARAEVIAAAMGRRKLPAIRGAIAGGFISTLLTDEATATALLDPE